jgi:hypothetical protein
MAKSITLQGETAAASAPTTKAGDKSASSTVVIDAATGAVEKVQKKPLVVLTKEQTAELEKCEAVIKKGWGTFLEVGKALAAIRDKELFRAKYDNFESYWKIELGYSRSYSYRLIACAEVSKQLSPIGDIGAKPLNESQLRELISVPEANRVEAWKSAIDLAGGEPVTAKIVHKAAGKYRLRRSGKKIKAATKTTAPKKLNLKPALKLLATAEKAAEKSKYPPILKKLAALRKCLEALAGK